MKLSLREVTAEAVAAYPRQPRTEWVLSWPGQVVLATGIIYWTSEVTQVRHRACNFIFFVLVCVWFGFPAA